MWPKEVVERILFRFRQDGPGSGWCLLNDDDGAPLVTHNDCWGEGGARWLLWPNEPYALAEFRAMGWDARAATQEDIARDWALEQAYIREHQQREPSPLTAARRAARACVAEWCVLTPPPALPVHRVQHMHAVIHTSGAVYLAGATRVHRKSSCEHETMLGGEFYFASCQADVQSLAEFRHKRQLSWYFDARGELHLNLGVPLTTPIQRVQAAGSELWASTGNTWPLADVPPLEAVVRRGFSNFGAFDNLGHIVAEWTNVPTPAAVRRFVSEPIVHDGRWYALVKHLP